MVVVKVSFLYSETNLPSVAFAPDSLEFFGWTVTMPDPSVVNPTDWSVLADRLGCTLPQTSTARAAYHVCDVVGGPTEDAVWCVRS